MRLLQSMNMQMLQRLIVLMVVWSQARGFEMIVGGHPDELFERDFDFVVRNPGINYKKAFLLRLKERGIPVYTEIELGYQVAQMQNYIAVTGTNGKTTTVTLIHDILKDANHRVCLAGNVGIPYSSCVCEYDLINQNGYDVVLEMSNFQLLDIDKFHRTYLNCNEFNTGSFGLYGFIR